MSVPVSIETFIVDGTPQSVTPLVYSIDSVCREREDIVAAYAIIPGYASADCYEDASQVGSFIDLRTTSIEAYVRDPIRIDGGFDDLTITAECVAAAPIDTSDAMALSEASAPFFDQDDVSASGVARISQTIAVFVEDGYEDYVFASSLDSVYVTATSVGTGNVDKTSPPLVFTAMSEKYQSPDEVAFDERLDDVSITATSTGVYSTEPLKPKVIEAYSGQSPDDGTLGKVGGTQGFFWG